MVLGLVQAIPCQHILCCVLFWVLRTSHTGNSFRPHTRLSWQKDSQTPDTVLVFHRPCSVKPDVRALWMTLFSFMALNIKITPQTMFAVWTSSRSTGYLASPLGCGQGIYVQTGTHQFPTPPPPKKKPTPTFTISVNVTLILSPFHGKQG